MKSIITFFKKMTILKASLLMLGPIFTIIFNMRTMLAGLLILILIDAMTAIRKAHHNEGIGFTPLTADFWRVIKSKQLRNTVRKSCEYAIYVIVFAIFQGMILTNTPIPFLGESYPITELVVIVLCLIEIYSVGENLETVNGNKTLQKIIRVMPRQIKGIFNDRDRGYRSHEVVSGNSKTKAK